MFYPFMMPQSNSAPSSIDELEKAVKLFKSWEEAAKKNNEDKDKKKDPPKKQGDVLMTAMFFTFATPFIMLIYGYLMTNMLLSVLEALAKIKGLH